MSRKFVVLTCGKKALVLSTFVAICTVSLGQTNPQKLPQAPSAELQKFDPFLGKYEVSGDYANLPWAGTLELKTVIKGWYIEQIIQITSPGIDREFWVLVTWDKDAQKYRLWGFQTLPSPVEGDVRFEGEEMITEFTYTGDDGQKATSTNRYKFTGKDELLVISYRQIGNGSVEKIGTLRGKRMGAESVGSSDAVPAIQMRRLSDVVAGRWSGTLTSEPGSHEGGHADETWRMSPGGLTIGEENHLSTPKRDSFDSAAVWWNRKAQKYQGIWCADINDEGCSGFDAQIESNRVTMTGEWEQNGHRRTWREIFSRPDQNSSIQTLYIGEPGRELKRVSAIRAAKITKSSNVTAETDLRPFMDEVRKASIEGDVEAIANSMTDDYVQTDINGYRQEKITWLNEYFRPLADLIKAGKFHREEYQRTNLRFRFYGDCAIVTGELHATGTGAKPGPQHTWVPDPNASFSGTLHFTHIYIKPKGKWMLAALHNQMPLLPANDAK